MRAGEGGAFPAASQPEIFVTQRKKGIRTCDERFLAEMAAPEFYPASNRARMAKTGGRKKLVFFLGNGQNIHV